MGFIKININEINKYRLHCNFVPVCQYPPSVKVLPKELGALCILPDDKAGFKIENRLIIK